MDESKKKWKVKVQDQLLALGQIVKSSLRHRVFGSWRRTVLGAKLAHS